MVNFAYFSLALGAADAWSFSQGSKYDRGTASLDFASRTRDPNYEPTPKRRPTIFSQMNKDTTPTCSMNPWIFLTLLDNNYSAEEKFSLFSSKDSDNNLKGSNGKYNDAVWASLVNCRTNPGVQKLMAIDALAQHKPEVIEDIFAAPTSDSRGFVHTGMKQSMFDSNLEFYKNYWKYNNYVSIFHNTGFNRYYKINQLFKLIGSEESAAQRYRDRRMLFANLKDSDAQFRSQKTQTSVFMPKFEEAPVEETQGSRWNLNSFMGQRQRPYNYRAQPVYQAPEPVQTFETQYVAQPVNTYELIQPSTYVAPAAPSAIEQIETVVESIVDEVAEIESQIETLTEVEAVPLPELTEKAEEMIETVEEEISELEGQIEALEEVEDELEAEY